MPEAAEIKGNSKRTVRLEPGSPGRVVKRFHAPGALDRLRDGLRARQERRALETAHALGLPVPKALEVTRRADRTGERRWELATELIPDAVSLAEILEGHRPWPVGRSVALCRLGSLLAAMARAGLHHPDLHPGNALLDGAGDAWLVDLRGTRFIRRAESGLASFTVEWTHHLVSLCAATRELLSPRERALCLAAFRRGLPADWSAALDDDTGWTYGIEDRARSLRRQLVARRTRVWFRESSPTVPLEDTGDTGVRRRDLEDDAAQRWVKGSAALADTANHSFLDRTFASKTAARRAWANAARLEEHRIPAARPACLDVRKGRGSSRVLFRVPRGCMALGAGARQANASEYAGTLGQLVGALHDRGFSAPVDPQSVLVEASSPDEPRLLLAPLFALVDFDETTRWRELATTGEAWGTDTTASALFRDAYLAALRHSGAERERLRRGWGRG